MEWVKATDVHEKNTAVHEKNIRNPEQAIDLKEEIHRNRKKKAKSA